MADCKLCNTEKGRKMSLDLMTGKKEAIDAALMFNMSIDDVNEHINHHDIPEPDNQVKFSELMDDPEFIFERLGKLLVRMESWMEDIVEINDGEIDFRAMNICVNLIKEIRATLKLIAELKGKLNTGDKYYHQYIQIQGNLNDFTGLIMNITQEYPECQAKIMEALSTNKLLTGE